MRFVNILATILICNLAIAEDGQLTPATDPATPVEKAPEVTVNVVLPAIMEPAKEPAMIKLMNPGAEVLIYVINDPVLFEQFNHLPIEYAGMILGCFDYRPEGFPQPRIVILGHWSKEIEVAMHEMEHYLEYMVPDRRCELRAAFQKLNTPDFGIVATDLKDHVPANGKPNPIVMGFPTNDD